MELLIFSILLISGIAYLLLIASYCYSWLKLETFEVHHKNQKTKAAIIIAARNEEKNIENCLKAITAQSYPTELFDIYVVDDDSEDNTMAIVEKLKIQNLKIISLKEANGQWGKKQAIQAGIKASNAELITTTDADCVMGKDWLASIIAFYEQTNAKMIVGPVMFHQEESIFEKMQTLEFMSLITSGAASLQQNKATMCNGANLAYTRVAFETVNGFEDIDQQPTGDDVLLMYKIKKQYPNDVQFLKAKEAIVYTKAKRTLSEFINQRKRWASKEFNTLNTETKITAIIVYSFNLILFTLLTFSLLKIDIQIMGISTTIVFWIFFSTKCIIDFLLLFLASTFFGKKKLLVYLLPEELLYIVYVSIIGVLGSIGKYAWKNR